MTACGPGPPSPTDSAQCWVCWERVMLLLRTVSLGKGPLYLAAFLLYGASMVGLYAASTLYHCLNTGVKGRIALRKYDHISIYFLIAGSYTPICLIVLPQEGGLVMLAAVWGWPWPAR